MSLRLATYNVHWWVGRTGDRSPSNVRAVLEELDADLVALQEVHIANVAVELSAHELAEAIPAGYRLHAGPTQASGCSRYGNLLLSKRPVVASACVDLSIPAREPRGAVLSRVLLEGGGTIVVAATHLGLGPRERLAQVQGLLTMLESFASGSDLAVVVAGDLNEWWPRARSLLALRRALGRSPAPASFPSRRPVFSLDRVFVRPASVLGRLTAHRSPLARLASDHLPVVAELRV